MMKNFSIVKTNKAFKKVMALRKQIQQTQRNVLVAFFKENPDIKTLSVFVENESNDGDYYDQVKISAINGIDFPYELSYELDDEETQDNWKSCFMALEMKSENINAILEIFQSLETEFVKSISYDTIKREDYVEPKRKTS